MKKWVLVTIIGLSVLLAGAVTLAVILQFKSSDLARERDQALSELEEVQGEYDRAREELAELKETYLGEGEDTVPGIEEAERTIRAFYDAWNAKDYEAMYQMMSPESIQVQDAEGNTEYFQGRSEHDHFIQSVSKAKSVQLLELSRYPAADIPQERIYFYRLKLDLDLGDETSLVPSGQHEMLQPVQQQEGGFYLFGGTSLPQQ